MELFAYVMVSARLVLTKRIVWYAAMIIHVSAC